MKNLVVLISICLLQTACVSNRYFPQEFHLGHLPERAEAMNQNRYFVAPKIDKKYDNVLSDDTYIVTDSGPIVDPKSGQIYRLIRIK